MEKEHFAGIIRLLNEPSVYFGRVSQLVEASGFSHNEAWLHLENQRQDFGLDPKYSTYDSYRKAKSVYHASGGIIRLLDDWPE
jgi:hypothetical protein